MNDELSYQNTDLGSQNPFTPRATLTPPEPVVAEKPSAAHSSKIPTDPKIKLLIVLAVVVVVLLIISLVVTAVRSTRNSIRPQATPTITSAPLPTDIPDTTSIPADLKAKFDETDQTNQKNIDFEPPQIDVSVGL